MESTDEIIVYVRIKKGEVKESKFQKNDII